MVRTGFYAGSFDPPTLGHVDLMERALAVVDRLVVGVGRNIDKAPWIPLEQRLALLEAIVPKDVMVMPFDGLAVAAARTVGASILLRGVRGPEDVAGELTMARANRRLAPECETVLLVSSPGISHISSRLVREVHKAGGDVGLFVPRRVAAVLAKLPPHGPPGVRA